MIPPFFVIALLMASPFEDSSLEGKHGTALDDPIPCGTFAPSLRSLTRSECLDIGRSQRLTADRPVSALKFIDAYPRDGAQAFAFDLNHRFGDVGDELLLLSKRENVFNYIDS